MPDPPSLTSQYSMGTGSLIIQRLYNTPSEGSYKPGATFLFLSATRSYLYSYYSPLPNNINLQVASDATRSADHDRYGTSTLRSIPKYVGSSSAFSALPRLASPCCTIVARVQVRHAYFQASTRADERLTLDERVAGMPEEHVCLA